MTKRKSLIIYVLIFQFFFFGLLAVALNPTIASSSAYNNYGLKSSAVDFSNATVVSDGFSSNYWNDDSSYNPAIAVDSNDRVHAVWQDSTDGVWGTDYEIMHANFAIPVPPTVSGPDGIPFGNFYLLFIAASIIGLVAYKKRKI